MTYKYLQNKKNQIIQSNKVFNFHEKLPNFFNQFSNCTRSSLSQCHELKQPMFPTTASSEVRAASSRDFSSTLKLWMGFGKKHFWEEDVLGRKEEKDTEGDGY